MGSHSSFLARKIPWTEEPGRLQSIVSHATKYTHTVSSDSLQSVSHPRFWVGKERKSKS